MKREFFNPFKPHIVEFANGKFAVRKLTMSGWKFYDSQRVKEDDYWWWDNVHNKWFQVDTKEMAQSLLEIISLRATISSKKITKVHQ